MISAASGMIARAVSNSDPARTKSPSSRKPAPSAAWAQASPGSRKTARSAASTAARRFSSGSTPKSTRSARASASSAQAWASPGSRSTARASRLAASAAPACVPSAICSVPSRNVSQAVRAPAGLPCATARAASAITPVRPPSRLEICADTSSPMAVASRSGRSHLSDQSTSPSLGSVSAATIRTRAPSRWIVPPSTKSTPSTSSGRSRYTKVELRPTIWNSRNPMSAVRQCSPNAVTSSREKSSPATSTNGTTATMGGPSTEAETGAWRPASAHATAAQARTAAPPTKSRGRRLGPAVGALGTGWTGAPGASDRRRRHQPISPARHGSEDGVRFVPERDPDVAHRLNQAVVRHGESGPDRLHQLALGNQLVRARGEPAQHRERLRAQRHGSPGAVTQTLVGEIGDDAVDLDGRNRLDVHGGPQPGDSIAQAGLRPDSVPVGRHAPVGTG